MLWPYPKVLILLGCARAAKSDGYRRRVSPARPMLVPQPQTHTMLLICAGIDNSANALTRPPQANNASASAQTLLVQHHQAAKRSPFVKICMMRYVVILNSWFSHHFTAKSRFCLVNTRLSCGLDKIFCSSLNFASCIWQNEDSNQQTSVSLRLTQDLLTRLDNACLVLLIIRMQIDTFLER
jgi:hypothetical protein